MCFPQTSRHRVSIDDRNQNTTHSTDTQAVSRTKSGWSKTCLSISLHNPHTHTQTKTNLIHLHNRAMWFWSRAGGDWVFHRVLMLVWLWAWHVDWACLPGIPWGPGLPVCQPSGPGAARSTTPNESPQTLTHIHTLKQQHPCWRKTRTDSTHTHQQTTTTHPCWQKAPRGRGK